jgi:hypothetical protein
MARVAETTQKTRSAIPMRESERRGAIKASMVIARPHLLIFHCSPDIGCSLGRTGVTREIVVVKGTFDPVFGHAIGIRGDTEGGICGGGPGTW